MPSLSRIPYIEIWKRTGGPVEFTETSMNESEHFHPPFRLGPWLVQPDLNRLQGPDGPVQIEPRVMKVLLCLAASPGTVLTRLQLLDEVWGESVVGEEILTRAVSELRRVFGDQARRPKYIETIRNHGYRLIAEVEAPESSPPGASAQSVAPADAAPGPVPPAASPVCPVFADPDTMPAATGGVPGLAGDWKGVLPPVLGIMAVMVALVILGPWIRSLLHVGPTPEDLPVPAVAVPLTSFPGREWHPALSPDGTRVAFIWPGPQGDNPDVYIKQRNSESPLRLTEDPGWAAWPAWSPDGQTIAFVQGEEEAVAICSVSSLGGAVRRLLEVSSYVDGLDWAPDGQSLVYSALDREAGGYRLFRLSLADLSTTSLPPAEPGHAGDFQPHFSPDGRQLAWLALDQSGTGSLYVRAVAGGEARRVTVRLTGVQGLAWRPDGSALVYAASPGGAFGLWQVSLERKGDFPPPAHWIPTPGDFAWNPSISPSSGDLVYEQVRVDQDLWRVTVISRDPWQVTTEPFVRSTRWEYEASFSPDGRQVALVTARSGTPEIWLANRQGQHLQQLTDLRSAGITGVRWSPDGRQLAFNAVQDGRTVIMVCGVGGGRPRGLTPDGRQEIFTGWAHDGRSILFGREEEEGWRIRRRSPAGGESVPVTIDGGIAAAETADGHFLYFTRPDRWGLWQVALDSDGRQVSTAEAELVLPDLAVQDRRNWALHEGHILWVLRTGSGALLADFDPATGQSSFITELSRFSGTGFGISPDGRSVIYARTGEMAGDLMLIPARGAP